MERCRGYDLYQTIARQSLTIRETAKIIKQLLQTVAYIHSKGIIHRDIKMHNILVDSSNL